MLIIPSAELKRAFSAWLPRHSHSWSDAPGYDENAPLALTVLYGEKDGQMCRVFSSRFAMWEGMRDQLIELGVNGCKGVFE
jgi:hypothetical protein